MNLPDELHYYRVIEETGALSHVNSIFRNHKHNDNWNSFNGCTPEKLLSLPERKRGNNFIYCKTENEVNKYAKPIMEQGKRIYIITPVYLKPPTTPISETE